jgi:hypothetical protein
MVMRAHHFAAFSLKTDVRSDAVRSVRDRLFSLRRGRGVLRSSPFKSSRKFAQGLGDGIILQGGKGKVLDS